MATWLNKQPNEIQNKEVATTMLSNSSASDSSDDESESISISLGSPVHGKRTRHTFENQVPINTQIVEEEEVVATPVIDGGTT